MSTVTIDRQSVTHLLMGLLGHDVVTQAAPPVDPHPATVRGLVSDNDDLVAVIGADLAFAHRSGAALAMIPKAVVEDAGGEADADLLEIYGEVANVLSRLVNEATPSRVRLDPGMTHSPEALGQIMANGEFVIGCEVTIDGYGSGNIGVWHLPV